MILRTRSPELTYEQGRKKVEQIDFFLKFLKYPFHGLSNGIQQDYI